MPTKEGIIVENFVINFSVLLLNNVSHLSSYLLRGLNIVYPIRIFLSLTFFSISFFKKKFRWAIVGLTDQWVQEKITQ